MSSLAARFARSTNPRSSTVTIAAGLVSGQAAFILVVACWGLGFVLAAAARPAFAGVAAGYVVLQVLYSLIFKRWVIVDVMAIAAGFVLRVVPAGTRLEFPGVAIDVPLSNWLFLCTLLLAVFLGFAKRRHELSALEEDASFHRANLSEYSVQLLDQLLSIVAASCIVAYGLYTVAPDTIEHVGSDKLKFTIPFVIYGIFRYLFLIHRRGAGGSPERVLLSDPPLLIDLFLYVAVAGAVLYL